MTLDLSKYKLRDKQIIAKDYIYNNFDKNLLVVVPTGYGKTLIAKMAMDVIIDGGEKVIMCAPQKALTEQHVKELQETWSVLQITGETQDIKYDKESLEEYDIFVFTYEKLGSILMNEQKRDLFFDDLGVGLVVIDEIHMIGDGYRPPKDDGTEEYPEGRGAQLEVVLLSLMRIFPLVKIVGLSATIKNADVLAQKMDAKLIIADKSERPVPLTVDVKLVPNTYSKEKEFNAKMSFIREVQSRYPRNKMIVFCSSQDRSARVPKRVAGIDGTRLYGEPLMNELLKHGCGFHNASLKEKLKGTRLRVEELFKTDPKFLVLGATTTLAAGINMPAEIVVIFDVQRWVWLKSEEELIPANEIHQMIGRAGRPGMAEFAYAVVLANEDYYDRVVEMVQGTAEVHSCIANNLKRAILVFVTSFVNSREAVHDVLSGCIDTIKAEKIDETIDWLIKNGFLREIGNVLESTYIGQQTSYSFIQPETAVHILTVDKAVTDIKSEREYVSLFDDLLSVDELTNSIVVRSNDNDKLALQIALKIHDFKDTRVAKAFSFIFKPFLESRGYLSEDEKQLITGSEVYGLTERCNRIFLAAQRLCTKHRRLYETLQNMLEAQMIDVEALALYNIKGIGQVRLKNLMYAGIKTLKDFSRLEPEVLSRIIRVSIETAREMLIKAKVEIKMSTQEKPKDQRSKDL